MSTNIIPPFPPNPTATDRIAEPSVLSDRTSPRHPTRRQFLQVAAGATLSNMALSGCGWTLSEVRSQPTSQASSKELYIYTWSSYTDQELLDRFAKETGIKVVTDVFDSNEAMLARLQAGVRSE